jgi:hypothetical protein
MSRMQRSITFSAVQAVGAGVPKHPLCDVEGDIGREDSGAAQLDFDFSRRCVAAFYDELPRSPVRVDKVGTRRV